MFCSERFILPKKYILWCNIQDYKSAKFFKIMGLILRQYSK